MAKLIEKTRERVVAGALLVGHRYSNLQQTTDDRRQTTDDRRQTTDDRRQTTDDNYTLLTVSLANT